MRHRNFEDSIM
ncbi:hypothetical protein HU200_053753 [Digitaria exilis]|uniref:Uncharacterized protein n=1 Tax=Digitaria exilis TaxID=1010633 RepID=A0A835ARC4_9POAL|nr:hypothetical protein HU200_053753 [Digitaria exilis]